MVHPVCHPGTIHSLFPKEIKERFMNPIIQSLFDRKSTRVFTEQPITAEEKDLILRAACQAPTAGNQQLYTILDITDPSIKNALVKTCDNQPFIADAKLVLIFCADCKNGTMPLLLPDASPVVPGSVILPWPCPMPILPPRMQWWLLKVWALAPAISATSWKTARRTAVC